MFGSNMREFLGVFISFLLSLLSALASYYQIFGYKGIWILLFILFFSGFVLLMMRMLYRISKIVKTFGERWSLNDGLLVIGNTVNVALRVRTLQILFNELKNSIEEDRYLKVTREAGKKAGRDFINDLRRELVQKGHIEVQQLGFNPSLLKKKLELWAKYDSTTGMGIFDVSDIAITRQRIQGVLTVKNSFLAFGISNSEDPHCNFLEGYIEGVISDLLNVKVNVREISCSAETGSGFCKFEVEGRIN